MNVQSVLTLDCTLTSMSLLMEYHMDVGTWRTSLQKIGWTAETLLHQPVMVPTILAEEVESHFELYKTSLI